jgi:hypothetical protein
MSAHWTDAAEGVERDYSSATLSGRMSLLRALYCELLLWMKKSINLTFCGPCIVIYLYNKDQQDALFSFRFILINNIYMFRAGLLLIIGRYCFVYTAVSI